jgi:predicted secreted protein
MTEAFNGTDIIIRVKTASQWLTCGLQLTHTVTETNTGIDVTWKGSGSWREILDEEGLQTIDVSSEIIFSNDAAYEYLRAAARSKSIVDLQILNGTGVVDGDSFKMYVTSVGDNAPDNDKTTTTVNFQSTEPATFDNTYDRFLTSDGEFFVTSDGDNFYVRA